MTKVIDNTDKIINDIEVKASIFLRNMCDEIIKISTPKTPKKTGRMRMDIVRQVLGLKGKVKWGKNYAVYQETKQFKHYTTPGTSSKFAESRALGAIKSTNSIAKSSGLI